MPPTATRVNDKAQALEKKPVTVTAGKISLA
jgi:hypothetical protein